MTNKWKGCCVLKSSAANVSKLKRTWISLVFRPRIMINNWLMWCLMSFEQLYNTDIYYCSNYKLFLELLILPLFYVLNEDEPKKCSNLFATIPGENENYHQVANYPFVYFPSQVLKLALHLQMKSCRVLHVFRFFTKNT